MAKSNFIGTNINFLPNELFHIARTILFFFFYFSEIMQIYYFCANRSLKTTLYLQSALIIIYK